MVAIGLWAIAMGGLILARGWFKGAEQGEREVELFLGASLRESCHTYSGWGNDRTKLTAEQQAERWEEEDRRGFRFLSNAAFLAGYKQND